MDKQTPKQERLTDWERDHFVYAVHSEVEVLFMLSNFRRLVMDGLVIAGDA